MNRRYASVVGALFCLMAVSASVLFDVYRETQSIYASLRASRIELQVLSQHKSRLVNDKNQEMIQRLPNALDDVKISLVESLLVDAWPAGVSGVTYEVFDLPSQMLNDSAYPVNTIRVVLQLTALHVVALSSYFEVISQHVSPMPSEVRGCEVFRHATQGLKAQCVLDVHVWSANE